MNDTGTELAETETVDGGRIVAPQHAGSSDLDVQVATAKAYPRSIKAFKVRALTMATLDEQTAESCFYDIPRAGGTIPGPSVRLAEIVASAWGNLRVDAKITGEDDRFVYSEAMAWDLETNVAIKYCARRRITNKQGKRFNDDMIAVTANAASSIAIRNAIFKVVPMAYVREIYLAARKTAVGDEKTLVAKRDLMIEHFGTMGVAPERVLATIEKPGLDDISLDDLGKLKGMATAIKDGELTIETAFPSTLASDNKDRVGDLTERVKAKKKDTTSKEV